MCLGTKKWLLIQTKGCLAPGFLQEWPYHSQRNETPLLSPLSPDTSSAENFPSLLWAVLLTNLIGFIFWVLSTLALVNFKNVMNSQGASWRGFRVLQLVVCAQGCWTPHYLLHRALTGLQSCMSKLTEMQTFHSVPPLIQSFIHLFIYLFPSSELFAQHLTQLNRSHWSEGLGNDGVCAIPEELGLAGHWWETLPVHRQSVTAPFAQYRFHYPGEQ